MIAYEWPGNVRQLGRVVERAIALAPGVEVGSDDLPGEISRVYGPSTAARLGDHTLRGWCSRYARIVLDRCDGNKRQACEILDISYKTLQSLLHEGADEGLPDAAATGVRLEQNFYEQAG